MAQVLSGPAEALRKGEFAGVFDFAGNVFDKARGDRGEMWGDVGRDGERAPRARACAHPPHPRPNRGPQHRGRLHGGYMVVTWWQVDGYKISSENSNVAYRVSSSLPPDDIDEQVPLS